MPLDPKLLTVEFAEPRYIPPAAAGAAILVNNRVPTAAHGRRSLRRCTKHRARAQQLDALRRNARRQNHGCRILCRLVRSLPSLRADLESCRKASCAAAPAMRIGVVDCVADASVCREFEIQGYPTIRLFAGKTQNRYHPAGASCRYLGYTLPTCRHGCSSAKSVLVDIYRLIGARGGPPWGESPPPDLPLTADALIERSERDACSAAATVATPRSPMADAATRGGASVALQAGEAPAELSLHPRPMEDVAGAAIYGLQRELFSTPVERGSRRWLALEAWLFLLEEALPGADNREAIGWIRRTALPKSHDAASWDSAMKALPTPWLPSGGRASSASAEGIEWRACRGNSATARGYPCALWSLFHTLLAHSAQPARALLAIQGYVEFFFGCRGCAEHFVGLAQRGERGGEKHGGTAAVPPAPDGRHGTAAASAAEASLWLWKAHNAVNARLNATGEEAVLRLGLRKVQWPSRAECPSCYVSGRRMPSRGRPLAAGGGDEHWNEAQVIQYLRAEYCHAELSPCASDLTLPSFGALSGPLAAAAAAHAHVGAAVDRAAAATVAGLPPTQAALLSALALVLACLWAWRIGCARRPIIQLRYHERAAQKRLRAVNAVGRRVAGVVGNGGTSAVAGYQGLPSSEASEDE